jgi:hypothetical protein
VDPAFYLNADPDPDPGSQTNADPDTDLESGQTLKSQKTEFLRETHLRRYKSLYGETERQEARFVC